MWRGLCSGSELGVGRPPARQRALARLGARCAAPRRSRPSEGWPGQTRAFSAAAWRALGRLQQSCELGLRGQHTAPRGRGRGPQLPRPRLPGPLACQPPLGSLVPSGGSEWATRCPVPADSSPRRPWSPVRGRLLAPPTRAPQGAGRHPPCRARRPPPTAARASPPWAQPSMPRGPVSAPSVARAPVSFLAARVGAAWLAFTFPVAPAHVETGRGHGGPCEVQPPQPEGGQWGRVGPWLRVRVAAQQRPWEPKEAGWPWGGGHRGRGACRLCVGGAEHGASCCRG